MTNKSGWSRFFTSRWLLIIIVGALACYIPVMTFLRALFSPFPWGVSIGIDGTFYGEVTASAYVLTYLNATSGLLSIVLLIVVAILLERSATKASIVLCSVELIAILFYSYTGSYYGDPGWLSIAHGILLLVFVLYGGKLHSSIWGIIWPIISLAITAMLEQLGHHEVYYASFAPDILIMLVLCRHLSIRKIVADLRSITTTEPMQSANKHAASIVTKSKVVAALLAFFLGTLGIHRYYLLYKKSGILQTFGGASMAIGYLAFYSAAGGNVMLLFISLVLLLYGVATYIWVFIDFICILTGSLAPADGSGYKENQPAQVQVIQSVPSSADSVAALEKLAALHQQGILTDEEFQQKKEELLTKI